MQEPTQGGCGEVLVAVVTNAAREVNRMWRKITVAMSKMQRSVAAKLWNYASTSDLPEESEHQQHQALQLHFKLAKGIAPWKSATVPCSLPCKMSLVTG